MRNVFDLSHEHKLSVDMGVLYPVLCDEVLPGDTYIHRASALARVAPLAQPLMHRCELRLHSFYVPNRIMWDDWEDFIVGETPASAKPTHTMTSTEPLYDSFGVPPVAGFEVDAFPMIAYNMIWNEFYRDQDLQAERVSHDETLARICWQKDYFTVARPQPQQGADNPIPANLGKMRVRAGVDDALSSAYTGDMQVAAFGDMNLPAASGETTEARRVYAVPGADGSVSIDIDDLRRSLALQRFAEARMRFGSRYIDYLRYCGVNPSDGRLDRPEYLGGGKEILNFSEVLSTAETTSVNVGDLYGHGIGLGRTRRYRKFFEEHGWVLTLLSVRPKTVYQNAVPKKFLRREVMDYWQKELEILPWQEIREEEIFAGGSADNIWGYVPRYEEYRHGVSHVSGTLRGGTENDWHMAREFATLPPLNGSFVECTPTDRIYQDANMPELIVNVMHSLRARRNVGQTASMGTKL